jgi:chromosome partitioning protein
MSMDESSKMFTDLLGTAELAELLGVTKQVIGNWRTRDPKFPAPVAELRSTPVWRKEDVLKWAKSEGIGIPERQTKPSKASTVLFSSAVVVAVVNMKGGVGKSTITANLGWYSALRQKKKVLLLDLDPQFNLSQYTLGSDRYEEIIRKKKPTVLDLFEQFSVSPLNRKKELDIDDLICPVRAWKNGGRLDIVPSRLDLAWTLKTGHNKKETLANFIEDIRDRYDLVLIDCPPTESILTEAAYLASDFLLVPIKPEFLSTIGLPLLAKSLEDFKKQHRDHLVQLAGIVFNAVSNHKAENLRSKADVKKVASDYKWHVFTNEISYSDSYPKGSRAGTPIFLTEYARWDRVSEFEHLADEFSKRIGL